MFQLIFILLSISKQRVYSASWFPQNKDQTPNTKKQTKRLPEELTKKQSRKERTEEIMRTSRSMGGKRQSTWDTRGPVPAVRCECHTIRVWPHQITFLHMRFSKWNRALTLFTPEQRWGQDGSSAGLEMGCRWGNNLSLFHIFLILQKTVLILFHFLLAWDSILFHCPEEETTWL